MIPGRVISEHLEIDILGCHIDGSIIAFGNDPGVASVIPHAFQAGFFAVHLIVHITVTHIEAVDPFVGQDFDLIPGQGVTTQAVIIFHIHIVDVIPLHDGIPQVAVPHRGDSVRGGIHGIEIMVVLCTVVVNGAVNGAGGIDLEAGQLCLIGFIDLHTVK